MEKIRASGSIFICGDDFIKLKTLTTDYNYQQGIALWYGLNTTTQDNIAQLPSVV